MTYIFVLLAWTARAPADGLARLADAFTGVSPAEYAARAMSGAYLIDGEPLTATDAFRLAIGRRALADGEVSAYQMEVFAALAPHVRDFADFVGLARAPGREAFVRRAVSAALVTGQLTKLKTWHLSAHDWREVWSYWYPATLDPRACAELAATAPDDRVFAIALTGVADPRLRECLARARRARCRTALISGGAVRRFP